MSAWVDQIFKAQQATTGGVVRRSVEDVERFGALEEIIDRARANRWHVIETGGQVIVLCHAGELIVHC